MGYGLGVDLGTTFTAAAVEHDGHVEMAPLGDRAAAVPSVVLVREDGTTLTGDAADRRSATDPDRVAREVKRRLGDPTPLVLGGSPYSPADLMARQLADVVRLVAERQGGRPDRVTLTHPANWGPYKRELFGQIPRLAGLDHVRMITEPEAAAAHYASGERLEEGALVAVYDLGGGTFDATVLRTVRGGFRILGTPEGVENLGGVDFDEAVVAHVDRSLDGAVSALDPADPRATASMVRLRQDCVLAKETLSADTETTIPVMLPELQTEVRLTRAEFEGMVQPSITATIASLRRALDSAEVTPDQLDAVLLVGGSSRIPMVARMVSAELGRPTAVDAHPKHAIVLGAALLSRPPAERPPAGAPAPAVPRPRGPVSAPPARPEGRPARAAGVGGAAAAGAAVGGAAAGPASTRALPHAPGGRAPSSGPFPRVAGPPSGPIGRPGPPGGPRSTPAAGMPAPGLTSPGDTGAPPRHPRRMPIVAAAIVALVVLGGGGAWAYTALSGSSPTPPPASVAPATPVAPSTEPGDVVSAEPAESSAARPPATEAPTRQRTTAPPTTRATTTTTRPDAGQGNEERTADTGATDGGDSGGGTGAGGNADGGGSGGSG
ncbi:Hsp70 family protein [Actinomycetospora cinnamomea]|uniref:Hsp70 protein n=1 Tax=Actinomycetospora cinnamomea TaxID=663609 RepID=A0A2U1F653_9PSEU|nr:Hsp70 family protein [Actinomycetospora cinnamomea]PVZ07667.1 Hsp70 protein [Actinomycetospora cinnamomea]